MAARPKPGSRPGSAFITAGVLTKRWASTPMAVWRDGVTGALGDKAVDMTLRLDNADALPTGPQPQQQQQALVWGIWCQAVSVDMALDLTKVALAGAWSPPFGPRRAGRASTLSLQAGP